MIGNVSIRKVDTLMGCKGEGSSTEEELEAKRVAVEDFNKWTMLEETSWR